MKNRLETSNYNIRSLKDGLQWKKKIKDPLKDLRTPRSSHFSKNSIFYHASLPLHVLLLFPKYLCPLLNWETFGYLLHECFPDSLQNHFLLLHTYLHCSAFKLSYVKMILESDFSADFYLSAKSYK